MNIPCALVVDFGIVRWCSNRREAICGRGSIFHSHVLLCLGGYRSSSGLRKDLSSGHCNCTIYSSSFDITDLRRQRRGTSRMCSSRTVSGTSPQCGDTYIDNSKLVPANGFFRPSEGCCGTIIPAPANQSAPNNEKSNA